MVEAWGRLRHRRRLYKADRRLPAPRAADLAGREQEDGIPVVEALKKDDVARLTELIEAGKLRPVIDRRYPLREVPESLRYLEAGHAKGKVVITM